MSDDLVKRLRATTDGATVNPDGPEAADRIAALEAAVTQCRTLSAMLKPQADRIAELEAALHAIVKICLVTSPYPGKDAQKMQSIAMATLIACDCAGQCKHYGECISDARAALEGGKDE